MPQTFGVPLCSYATYWMHVVLMNLDFGSSIRPIDIQSRRSTRRLTTNLWIRLITTKKPTRHCIQYRQRSAARKCDRDKYMGILQVARRLERRISLVNRCCRCCCCRPRRRVWPSDMCWASTHNPGDTSNRLRKMWSPSRLRKRPSRCADTPTCIRNSASLLGNGELPLNTNTKSNDDIPSEWCLRLYL